jgi:hypothetical protein
MLDVDNMSCRKPPTFTRALTNYGNSCKLAGKAMPLDRHEAAGAAYFLSGCPSCCLGRPQEPIDMPVPVTRGRCLTAAYSAPCAAVDRQTKSQLLLLLLPCRKPLTSTRVCCWITVNYFSLTSAYLLLCKLGRLSCRKPLTSTRVCCWITVSCCCLT